MPWREIHWTDESVAHIAEHGVRPEEVEELVNSRPRYTTNGRDGTDLIYGTTNAGRYLVVVASEALNGLDYIVTARKMEPEERREFRKHAR